MKSYELPAGTCVTLISPTQVSTGLVLKGDVVLFENARIGPDHWGFRFVGEGEIGFALKQGWGDASHGVLVVKMDGGKDG